MATGLVTLPPIKYYHSSVRKLTAAFGSLFTNVLIDRIDSNGNLEKTIRVPLSYASGDKTIKMLLQQSTLREQGAVDIKVTVPRMSFELTNMTYDSVRKVQPMNRLSYTTTTTERTNLYSAAPYNFEYTLNIFTKYIDDSLQIIEQILPYFQPQYTVTINDIPTLSIIRDVPITISSITKEDTYEGAVEEDRILQWTLTFIANGWIYPPIQSSTVIKKTYTNLLDFDTEEVIYGTYAYVNPETAGPTDSYTIEEISYIGATSF